MHVVNIIEEGRWGGPQKRITLVADALKRYGVVTTVLLPMNESDNFQQALSEAGIAWKSISLHRLGRGLSTLLVYGLTFIVDVYKIWRELRSGGYDLLHVSGGAWQFKGPIAGRLAGVPVVWHLNDTQMPIPLVALFKWLGKFADGFFVAARRVKQYYIDGTHLQQIPTYPMPAPVITSDYLREYAISDEDVDVKPFPRIVTVSNVNPIKGLETLIEASAELKERLDTFSVSIVGSIFSSQKEYYLALKQLIAKYCLETEIAFTGERQHVQGVLKSADIYVCSSVAEASPMAVWEAMSMGCAIVSTDVGDVADYIKDGENGFVVPVGDAKAMANAICKLAENEVLRKSFGEQSRIIACRNLDIDMVAQKTASAYREILERNSR